MVNIFIFCYNSWQVWVQNLNFCVNDPLGLQLSLFNFVKINVFLFYYFSVSHQNNNTIFNMALKQRMSTLLKEMKTWRWHHVFVFFLTFFSYAFFHGCRKSFSNVKDLLSQAFTANSTFYPYDTWQTEHMFPSTDDADVFLGELDSLFLFAYAFGLYINGVLGDRLNLRYFLAFGMCSSALVTFAFGYLGAIFHVRSLWFYRILQFVNGLFQSIGWPSTVSIMGNWFGKNSSGVVFGVWSANASLGNIIGSVILAQVLMYGYEFGMLLNAFILFCGGLVIFFCLVVHPVDLGLPNPNDQKDPIGVVSSRPLMKDTESLGGTAPSKVVVIKPKAIGFIEAVLIPGVIPYSLAYACLKLVNYSFFFWLPTYLKQGLGWQDTKSVEFSNFYDAGGIVGGIFTGLATDLMGFRSPIVSGMLLLSVGTILLFNYASGTYGVTVGILVVNGFLIGGVANTISTAITADLGKHEKIQGSAEALATVTGIIDGTGSVGAAIGQYLVGVINKHAGWRYVFFFLILMTALSFVCILPMLINEMKLLLNRRNNVTDTGNMYQPVGANSDESDEP